MWFKEYSTIKYKILTFFSDIWKSMFSLKMGFFLWFTAFISHSASRENLAHIFKNLLPNLTGKHLLDVGSRFGAVMFGAFAYSQASRITGVEINSDLAALSLSMVQKYNMQVITLRSK